MGHLEDMIRFYENEGQEELRLHEDSVQNLELLTAKRYFDDLLKTGDKVLDSCAGTGVYAFYLAHRGCRVTAGDIVPYNVEAMRAKQGEDPVLDGIYGGDARDLSHFSEGAFDAVLLMGALYHLPEADSRKKALREGLRVLRPGGLLFATYMNRYGVIFNNIQPALGNLDDILRFARDGHEGIYYASTAGEMQGMVEDCGFVVEKHIALDGPALFLRHTAQMLDDTGFERWKEFHFAVCEDASLLGNSYHNLVVAKKPG